MTKPIVSEAMVEAGARAMTPEKFPGVDDRLAVLLARSKSLQNARACLEAALAVRDQEQ